MKAFFGRQNLHRPARTPNPPNPGVPLPRFRARIYKDNTDNQSTHARAAPAPAASAAPHAKMVRIRMPDSLGRAPAADKAQSLAPDRGEHYRFAA